MQIASSVIMFIMLAAFAAGCNSDRSADNEPERDLPEPAASAEEANPLEVGDRIPPVRVADSEGRSVDLSKLAAEKPTVFIFYRGGWCPYCTTHLGALGAVESRLIDLGYQVIAISADRPEKAGESAEEHDFKYRLLSDSKMDAARAFGIAFKVDDKTIEQYHEYGIDLEDASGETHYLLPVPAVFIAGTDGVIRYAYSNPDYTIRLEPEGLLEAAEEAVENY